MDYVSKINELKEQLELELSKEEVDMVLVNKIRGKIMWLGVYLTPANFSNR